MSSWQEQSAENNPNWDYRKSNYIEDRNIYIEVGRRRKDGFFFQSNAPTKELATEALEAFATCLCTDESYCDIYKHLEVK